MRTMTNRRVGIALSAVIAMALGACGNGGDGGGEVSEAGIDEAKAVLSEYSANPTGIGYDQPPASPIPDDKLVVALETPVAVAQLTNDYRERSLEAIGWRMERIVVGGGPEDPVKAMEQALEMGPDAIFYAGYDPAIISEQLNDAAKAGIPVIAESVVAEDEAIVGVVRDATSNDLLGKMSAAFVVADSKGKANVEFFSVPSQPIITTYLDSFQAYVDEWCPACTVNVNNFEFSDIGSNLPGMVVSALQRNPDADYVVLGLGDAIVGIEPALASAGLTEQVKLGGAIPSLANYEALKNGDPGFWAVDNPPSIAYRETDLMIRAILGEDIAAVNDAPLPAQVLTADNIDDAVFDDDGYWLGYADWESDYLSQWGLG